MPATDLDQIVNLCKRRGFVYPSAEIYGGFRSSYDYGPLGSLMLRNVREAWIRTMVQQRDDVVLIDAAILGPPQVFEASGHLANFSDPLVDCTKCKQRFREDHLTDPNVCPNCGAEGSFTEARAFNLMFKTQAGPVEGAGAEVYLRPETAQGMFVNFVNVLQTSRKKPPFGIAQVGKSFRNEITPGNFIFRTREFEQMEMEFFVPPAEGPKWYEYWCEARLQWYVDLGIPREMLLLRAHDADELSHYSAGTSDVEFLYPWGWGELEGIAQRTDFDLNAALRSTAGRSSTTSTRRPTSATCRTSSSRPAGVNRAMAAFLLAAYDEDEIGGEPRTVLRLHPRLAPYKVAVLPLSKKDTLTPLAQQSLRHAERTATWSTTTRRRRSASATAGRTRSARRCASPSTSTRSTTARSRFATATPPRRCGCRSTRSRPRCGLGWGSDLEPARHVIGSRTPKVVPPPSSLVTQTSPPIASTSCRTIARPRPLELSARIG